jgi:hypothetical protein
MLRIVEDHVLSFMLFKEVNMLMLDEFSKALLVHCIYMRLRGTIIMAVCDGYL